MMSEVKPVHRMVTSAVDNPVMISDTLFNVNVFIQGNVARAPAPARPIMLLTPVHIQLQRLHSRKMFNNSLKTIKWTVRPIYSYWQNEATETKRMGR